MTPYYKMKIKLPQTEWAASHVLSLPVQPNVTAQNLSVMAKALREVIN
jgi:dTDP-4-amino-4,6-dideoxygalactose transaminase